MVSQHREIVSYERGFGSIAVERGFITPVDLFQVLAVQVHEDMRFGTHRLMGEILLDKDIMSPQQIEEVVTDVFQL